MSTQSLAAMPSGYLLHGSYPVVDLSPQQYDFASTWWSNYFLRMQIAKALQLSARGKIMCSREGVTLSLIHAQDQSLIESDVAEVTQDRSVLGHIVAETKTLPNSERVEGLRKVPRSKNVAKPCFSWVS
jgi:hypothetical protein